ncbi:trimeric intracellular cation channel family protein [Bacillus atrophaeus]|uniref:trimeric intracellular cation channel family protein n=1 Tax=Bacillus atrophaeus TaxID=1452 RepID=UPI00227E618A|nr:trimeric intracellular cation channel family protein [Bacillus atrophaeus]MCY8931488.1 trimeric intracellular cation channel family protein [Bacillus atrophaeus]MCY8941920.1 trimeric intracellular cation channel family protein [Bacillus atrophaeus]MCY8947495.1 trimeric intracellular cation channel family protein [Bacillus atrophaeus]
MAWELLSVIGIIAFAVSGAIRNVLIGVPVSALWEQGAFFQIALASITIVFLFPKLLLKHWNKWGNLSDAIGLAAFTIQGALYAVKMGHPLSAVIVAAVLTGSGGGIVRDLLAGRKPMVLKAEIYAVWAALGGLIVGLGWMGNSVGLYVLFIMLVACRVCSYMFKWKLPNRSFYVNN